MDVHVFERRWDVFNGFIWTTLKFNYFFDGLTDHITEHVFSRQDSCSHKVAMRSLLCLFLWFSPANPVSSTNKTDCQELFLKVALHTITVTHISLRPYRWSYGYHTVDREFEHHAGQSKDCKIGICCFLLSIRQYVKMIVGYIDTWTWVRVGLG